jgi:ApaG protein
MSDTTTEGIRIEVGSTYVPENSIPDNSYYFFAYRVRISNVGDRTAQLISRKWVITDANGQVETVQGAGVVGEQPLLEPGQCFEYTSYCPLPTPVGSMQGAYRMVDREGRKFEAIIAPFSLAVPTAVN